MSTTTLLSPVKSLTAAYDRERFDDVGFMTCMTLVMMGNYAQTGHFGGPLAYTPYNVALHLAGPDLGGLRYDYRRPKHPFCDKFMLAGGHNVPTSYALWMIMGEALSRKHAATGDARYRVDPNDAMLPIDALGFRRGAGALATLLKDNDLDSHPLFAQAGLRGIRALAGHAETTDVTNDVNGGPSGIGIATAAGKAAFWNFIGAPDSLKILGIEGEFAMTEGHAQELKTQAVAMQVGKRLRVLLSLNNAGIDDTLIGGVIDAKFDRYEIEGQWTSYGWNVFALDDGNDYDQVLAALKTMEDWDAGDRRPMIVLGRTVKGYWPAAVQGKIPGYGDQLVSYASHPYAMKMNSEYFVALAETFEKYYGVEFQGIRDGAVSDTRERLIQFKTNIDVVMSVLDRNGLGDWLADRLADIGDTVRDDTPTRIDTKRDPFLDDRLQVRNLPVEPQTVTATNPLSKAEKEVGIQLFREAGEVAGTRRGISEIIKWVNYVTDNRFHHPRRRLVGIDQRRARQSVGSLPRRRQPAGHALQGADPGGRQRLVGDRAGEPERQSGPAPIRRSLGAERHVRRLHAAHVSAGAGVEPAEPGQSLPHGCAAYSGRPFRAGDGGGRAHPLRHLCAAGVEAVPARPGHPPELLGLQRRGAGLFRRCGNRRPRPESRRHHS